MQAMQAIIEIDRVLRSGPGRYGGPPQALLTERNERISPLVEAIRAPLSWLPYELFVAPNLI